MKNIFAYVFVLLLAFNTLCHAATDDTDVVFCMTSDCDTLYKGEELSITLSVNAKHDINISTFKISISFDQSKLKFKRCTAVDRVNSSEIKHNLNDSALDIIFLTKDKGVDIAESENVTLMQLDFKALEPTDNQKICIDFEVDGVGNFDEKYLYTSSINDVSLEILEKSKSSKQSSRSSEKNSKDSKKNRSSSKGKSENKNNKTSNNKKVANTNPHSASDDGYIPTTETSLDVNNNDANNKAIILRENGFSFVIFGLIVFAALACLFFIWHRKKNNVKPNND